MLSEYAQPAGATSSTADAASKYPLLGFEQGAAGGRSYGLEELVQKDPPFTIGRVQYPLNAPLLSLACASNILVLVLAGSASTAPRIVRIDLGVPDNERTVDLYNPASPPGQTSNRNSSNSGTGSAGSGGGPGGVNDPASVHRLFLDPSGRHILVSTLSGDNYYLYSGWDASVKRARYLPKLRGITVNAVSWNSPLAQSSSQVAATTTSTKEILLGDLNGNIYEAVLDAAAGGDPDVPVATALRTFGRGGNIEKHFKLVYLLSKSSGSGSGSPHNLAITGLRAEIWAGVSSSSQRRRAVVIASTVSRIYQFVGAVPSNAANVSLAERDEGGMYDDLFKVYRDLTPKSLELPGDSKTASELHFWQASSKNVLEQPKTVAWLTGPGIYHGALSYTSQEAGDGVIDSAQLLPYPSSSGKDEALPLSMALTKYHLILLYRDKVKVVRVLDDTVVFEEALDIRPNERVRGLSSDITGKTYWLYTDASIFELAIKDEDSDLWLVYLSKQSFDTALKYAKTAKQRNRVHSAQGDAYFAQGRYIQAAEAFAQSEKTFEGVVLSFMMKEEKDALRFYLVRCLERLKKSDLTQRMMLATWLVEIYLSKINQLEDIAASEGASDDVENYHMEKSIIEDDLKQFLQQYKDNLDRKTIFELIASHGRPDMLLHFATVVGDYARVVAHWISEEDWQAALIALAKQNDTEPYYRYAPVLMRHVPRESVDAFTRQHALQARKLIPALLQPGPKSQQAVPHAIRYLEFAIFSLHTIDPAVHNTLLNLLATSSDDEAELLHFLQTAPLDDETQRPYYDLDYGLRICKTRKRVQACVEIYSKMGLFESSVDLALENGDLELAKANADMPRDDDLLRKKLWLKIAKHIVRDKSDLKTAMQFLEDTTLLKIEDILPFFPDFVTIDDFKDDICEALDGYSAQIESLKAEMSLATESAEAIKRDIAELQNRFVVVDAQAKCDSCGAALLARQFYVFPCQHSFHADCLIKEVTQHLAPTTLRRVIDLQNQIAREAKTNDTKAAQILGTSNAATSSLESLGLVSGRKLAQASVQGLDQLRKLVLPDALVTVIGGGIMSTVGAGRAASTQAQRAEEKHLSPAKRSRAEKMREELDDLLASSCVYCDTAVDSLDRPFLAEGEEEF